MSQQALDLRTSMLVVRRHKFLVSAVVAVGMIAGGAYAWVHPPVVTSSALIVLPEPPGGPVAAPVDGVTDPYTATQEIIADSTQVLVNALPQARPPMSLQALQRDVQVGSVTPYVISVTARGDTAADAEATANAVARSYVQYVGAASNPAEHVVAQLLEPAASATGPSRIERLVLEAVLGALAGMLIGAVIALVIGRNDRRLRGRDEIADSIGVPVLASFPVVHPSDAAGWTRLLDEYEPAVLHSLQLRNTLRQLGMAASPVGNGSDGNRLSVTVLSLSSDPRALALGPQLAVFAASQGIPTVLIFGPQQDQDLAATLRTACAVPPAGRSKRSESLRIVVSDDAVAVPEDAVLTVVVVAVDGKSPRMHATQTMATLLGVSSGAASADQLARVAVSADTIGQEITGILVADPEPTDHTTGRIPQLSRPLQRKMPTRLAEITTETGR
jgi:capsular polysaccharide biosynthesis protein